MKHFAAGQKAILAATYDATAATAAADEIRRLIGITFARATLKYSSTMKNAGGDPYSGTYHAEGFCAANSRNTLHFDTIEGGRVCQALHIDSKSVLDALCRVKTCLRQSI